MFELTIGNKNNNSHKILFNDISSVYKFIISQSFRNLYTKVEEVEFNPVITIVEYSKNKNSVKNKTIYNTLSDLYMHRKSEYKDY